MPYYLMCACRSNTNNIFAKFHENIRNISQNTKNAKNTNLKILKMCLPLLPQKKQRITKKKYVQNSLINQIVLKK